MAPRSVICNLCGGKFFKASLAHHQKVCREKVGKQCHECPYCHSLWPMLEMDAHIMTCPAAQAAGARPTGASAALAKKLSKHRDRVAAGIDDCVGEECKPCLGGGGMGDVSELGDDGDARVPCHFCGRKFAMDRIGKHQAICQKLSKKPKRKVVIMHEKPTKPEPTPKSDWRRKSEDLRMVARAARGDAPLDSNSRPRPPAAYAVDQNPHKNSPMSTNPATIMVQQQFRQLDLNGDGVLSPDEMDGFLRSIDPCASHSELNEAFDNIDKNRDGDVDFDEFVDYILGGGIKKPAAGSALDIVRQKNGARLQTPSKVAPTSHMGRSGALGKTSSPFASPGGEQRSRSPSPNRTTGGTRRDASHRSASSGAKPLAWSTGPLPQWGSGGPSRYGRDCMTAPPTNRTTPHNTSWGGCAPPAVAGKDGFESTRSSLGNPLDRSWLNKAPQRGNAQLQKVNGGHHIPAPASVSAAPVLLGRTRGRDDRHVHFE